MRRFLDKNNRMFSETVDAYAVDDNISLFNFDEDIIIFHDHFLLGQSIFWLG
jgi:hypothetical protein